MKNSRLYIPEPILALIVSYVSEQGIDALKNWIKDGHVGKLAAFSDETLTRVRLDKSPYFIYMSSYNSLYFSFYSKCLEKSNPYALYLHSLSLGFRCLDLCGAISILSTCKERFPLAKLLYIALNRCAGIELIDDFNSFNRENKCFFDVSLMANKLIGHISASEPKCFGSYSETFLYEEYPDCWLIHELNNEFNGERCSQCLYFYLFRDILLLS